MNIASAKVDELAQRLARLTGEDVETGGGTGYRGAIVPHRTPRTAGSPGRVAQVF